MTAKILRTLLVGAGMAAWAVAQAQDAPLPPGDTEIVVSARMTADEIGKASHEMARTLTEMTVGDQVPRWAMPVCVRVEGLEAALAEKVRATIGEVGKAAGAKMAKARCNPNVFVIFASDGAALAGQLADRLPAARNRDGKIERAAFAAAPGPLRWETRVSVHDARHGPRVVNSAALMGAGDGFLLRNEIQTTESSDPSLIRKQTRAVIDGMMVVVDRSAADGLELDQLSEYIAMVVLARPPMSASFDAHASILNLGRHTPPGPNPLRLSEWDRAYLAALYAAPSDRSAAAARSLIAHRMTKELANN